MDAQSQFEALEKYLDHQRNFADYLFITGSAVLIYDYLLNIGREISYWRTSKWSYLKVMFIVVRYVPMVDVYFVLHNQLLLNVDPASCHWTFGVTTNLILVGIILGEGILMIRTWAVWNRSKNVAVILAVLIVATLTLSLYGDVYFERSLVYSLPPYPGFRGCFVTGADSLKLNFDFSGLVVLETIVLLLMILSTWNTSKGGRDELSTVVHRDGVLFYVYLLAATVTNLVIMNVAPPDLKFSFIVICGDLYSVLSCRVVLDIREFRAENLYETSEEDFSIPLQFISMNVVTVEDEDVRTPTHLQLQTQPQPHASGSGPPAVV